MAKDKGSGEVLCPAWMVTMGDAMSLLLTFFVLLLTFSTVQKGQLMDALGFLKGGLGATKAASIVPVGQEQLMRSQDAAMARGGTDDDSRPLVDPAFLAPVSFDTPEWRQRFTRFEEQLRNLGFADTTTLRVMRQGVTVSFRMDKLFAANADQPLAEARPALAAFADLIGGFGNEVRLTARFPVPGNIDERSYAGRWGLAIRRGTAIGDLLQEHYAIHRSRLSFGARAESGDSPATLDILLVEKAGVRQIDIEELMQLEPKVH